jgi:DnaJ-class molecular chaperone
MADSRVRRIHCIVRVPRRSENQAKCETCDGTGFECVYSVDACENCAGTGSVSK